MNVDELVHRQLTCLPVVLSKKHSTDVDNPCSGGYIPTAQTGRENVEDYSEYVATFENSAVDEL